MSQAPTRSSLRLVECVTSSLVVLEYTMEVYCQSSRRFATIAVLADAIDNSRQVVEILFARGLVKILFATETFAMVFKLPLVLLL
jgi:hypothetical protein